MTPDISQSTSTADSEEGVETSPETASVFISAPPPEWVMFPPSAPCGAEEARRAKMVVAARVLLEFTSSKAGK